MDTTSTAKKNAYLDALDKRVLVFDGAMGTTLQAYNLSAEDYGESTWQAVTTPLC